MAGPGIAIPDLEVAVVGMEPTELQKRLDISFQSSVDDLDYVDIALPELDSGDRLSLIRHQRAPSPGDRVVSRAQPSFTSGARPNSRGVRLGIERLNRRRPME
jgi:hypothetical protein